MKNLVTLMEDGVKITRKPKAKAPTEAKAEVVETVVTETPKAPKAKAPKAKNSEVVTVKAKAPAVEAKDVSLGSELAIAVIFPKELEHETLGKLQVAKISDFKSFKKAIEDGKELFLTTYWNARQIKEFQYGKTLEVKAPKSFPEDLDILQAVYVGENVDRFYAVSMYTEAMFRFESSDFDYVPVKSNDGTEFKCRYSNGLEFEIYTKKA
jgi:hypothetical protein